MRVLIVADNVSARRGGEAILPLHYFRRLRARGIETWLIAHDRTRDELAELLGPDIARVHFVPDTRVHQWLERVRKLLPTRLQFFTVGFLSRLLSQLIARKLARQLVVEHQIQVVHQPTPVSPRESSLLHSLGAPVVIGPMNGGMTFPPGFTTAGAGDKAWFTLIGRRLSIAFNWLFPGKRRAAVLLVANPRTRDALNVVPAGQILELVENGVDLSLWKPSGHQPDAGEPTRFIFIGRLEAWKGADMLLDAFARMAVRNTRLQIVGDGPPRAALEAQAKTLGIADRVTFSGFRPQPEVAQQLSQSDVMVLPSIYECGGAVVLEAMACARPVIAAAWGGPKDYLDSTCGVLIEPTSREQLVADLASAMDRLASDPTERQKLGENGRRRVAELFDWERKIDRILEIYDLACGQTETNLSPTRPEPIPPQPSPAQSR
jgi:glycosyltransferase involved in cell wall biosynthesis